MYVWQTIHSGSDWSSIIGQCLLKDILLSINVLEILHQSTPTILFFHSFCQYTCQKIEAKAIKTRWIRFYYCSVSVRITHSGLDSRNLLWDSSQKSYQITFAICFWSRLDGSVLQVLHIDKNIIWERKVREDHMEISSHFIRGQGVPMLEHAHEPLKTKWQFCNHYVFIEENQRRPFSHCILVFARDLTEQIKMDNSH